MPQGTLLVPPLNATPASTQWPALLLPLRLEIRRIDDDLCIRVFPDQPFVDTHQDKLTQEEVDVANQYPDLQRVAASGPNDAADLDNARGQWRELARRYGPTRAAWILETLRVNNSPTVADSASEKIPQLFLLPERFVFLVYQGTTLRYAAAGNDITELCTLLPKPTIATVPDPTPPPDGLFDADSRWMTDFDDAVAKGLGARIRLTGPHAAAPVEFSEIVVVGLRAGGTPGWAGADTGALEEFLRQHHYTGGVEFLPYGTPTNNTDQAPSGYSESEEQLLASYDVEVASPLDATSTLRWPETAAGQFARAVGLSDNAPSLGHIKGAGAFPNDGFAETLRALWGATGDYFYRLIVGPQKTMDARGMLLQHVAAYLRPRGALATLRVDNLPFGILPVTRTGPASVSDPTGWKPDSRDHRADSYGTSWDALDTAFHRAISALLPLWLKQARDSSVVPRAGESGDPDEELLQILGMAPHSLDYRVRPIVDQTLIGFLMLLFRSRYFGAGSGFDGLTDPDGAIAAWQQEWQLAKNGTITLLQAIQGTTTTPSSLLLRAFAWGNGTALYMPFVRDPDTTAQHHDPEDYIPFLIENAASPDPKASTTLLYDVLRRSLLMNPWPQSMTSALDLLKSLGDYPIVAFFNNTVTEEKLKALGVDLPSGTSLTDLVNSLNDPVTRPYSNADVIQSTKFAGSGSLFADLKGKLWQGFETRLDAGLRDVCDALTYRLDAWFTTLAARRLDLMRDRQRLGVHWGAYGYLEDVALPARTTARGQPSTGGGFIHAPSLPQANAAAILRSGFDAHRDDEDGNAYAVNLTSQRVGRGLALIDGVQQGQELTVQLGYQLERGLHDARLDRLVERFRKAFPLTAPDPTDSDAPQEVVAPRNVCDGSALTKAYAESASGLAGLNVDFSDVSSSEQDTVRGFLDGLGDATDAVADLLQFEGVYQAVQGNYERSGSALDASAGVGKPPDIKSVATPLSGTNLRHRICSLLPSTESTTPGARAAAEARLNAWVENIFGSFGVIGCRVRIYGSEQDMNPTTEVEVRLDALGISGLDFVHMCSALPGGGGDSEIELRIKRYASAPPPAANSILRIAFDEAPVDGRSVADAMELGRAILELFGNTSTFSVAALLHPDSVPSPKFSNSDVGNFKQRAVVAMSALADQNTALGSTDTTTLLTTLDVCAGFGIQEAILGGTNDTLVVARAAAVAPIVAKRVAAAEALLDSISETSGGDERIEAISSAFKALFGDSFVALPTFDPPADLPLAAFDGTTLTSEPGKDRVWLWLQQVADTHPRVRALESLLMAADAWGELRMRSGFPEPLVAQLLPLEPPSAQPSSPPPYGWQALSDTELGATVRPAGCQSIVALTPPGLALDSVAGFVLDEWTETIPATEIATGVSFEYNQPAQQAPQCFLLAVPGNLDAQTWSAEHLAGIVRDTMDLARARLVDLDALPAVAALFPALWFPIPASVKQQQIPKLLEEPAQPVPPPSREFAHAF